MYLATLDLRDIHIKPEACDSGTSDAREEELIKELKPLYNLAMTDNLFRCMCNPEKVYKNRKAYNKHMHNKHYVESVYLIDNEINN